MSIVRQLILNIHEIAQGRHDSGLDGYEMIAGWAGKALHEMGEDAMDERRLRETLQPTDRRDQGTKRPLYFAWYSTSGDHFNPRICEKNQVDEMSINAESATDGNVDLRYIPLEKALLAVNQHDGLIAENQALREALEAIIARIQGVFDHPALVKFGGLAMKDDDVLAIAQAATKKVKNG